MSSLYEQVTRLSYYPDPGTALQTNIPISQLDQKLNTWHETLSKSKQLPSSWPLISQPRTPHYPPYQTQLCISQSTNLGNTWLNQNQTRGSNCTSYIHCTSNIQLLPSFLPRKQCHIIPKTHLTHHHSQIASLLHRPTTLVHQTKNPISPNTNPG